MTIAAVFEFPGEPVEKYHRVFEAGEAIVNQPDRIYHVCYRTETGFTVIDIWADEQSFAAFGETLGPAVQRAGLDAKPAVYPVEQYMTAGRHPQLVAHIPSNVSGSGPVRSLRFSALIASTSSGLSPTPCRVLDILIS